MKQFHKIIIWLIIICLLACQASPAYSYTLIPEYLCEIGLKLYKQGYINDALIEFNKALIANPDYRPASEYIRMIREGTAVTKAPIVPVAIPVVSTPVISAPVTPALMVPTSIVPLPPIKSKPMPSIPVAPVPAPVIKPKVEPVAKPTVIQPAVKVEPAAKPTVIQPAVKVEPVAKPKSVEPVITAAAPSPKEREIAMEKAMGRLEALLPEQPVAAPVKIPAPSRAGREKAIEGLMKSLEASTPLSKPVSFPPAAPMAAMPVSKKETKEIALPQVLILDESVKALTSALEIEQGKSIVISGHNIQRFLLTQPNVLNVERRGSNELLVTASDFGYTYLHIWDEYGRWTLEFLTVPEKPQGPTYEELLRRSEEKANSFRLRYNIDWSSFYSSLDGKAKNLKRTSYAYNHNLYLNGPSPYGDIDSSISVRSLKKSTDLTYFTMGITKGKIGPFDDFTLRAADYTTPITNLQFSSPALRGVMLQSPAFNKKLDYTVFWGREGGGRFGGLSPGLSKIKHSFLSGLKTDYYHQKNQEYGFSVFHGWGRDRPSTLNSYGYDTFADWDLGEWDLRYEIGYDSEHLSNLFTTEYEIPKLKFTEELRNTDKRFVTMTGTGWRQGEIGSLSTVSYAPYENLSITGRLDAFRDRLFPNPNNPQRWNTDFRTDLDWRLDSLTSLRTDYTFLNELGRISSFRSYNTGLGLYKTFDWKRRVSTFLNYRHQEDKHFTSPKLDYTNEKVGMGVRFGLVKDLYYFLNKEFNWLQERFTGNNSRPEVTETGLDWSGQILNSPFFGSMRFLYRDEKDTGSTLSFLSGEDYIEGYTTLSYRPTPEQEWYLSSRLRKIWPEKTELNKRIEADFNAGLRYLWDTGVRWEPIGLIEGYVFKDADSDGIKEEGEGPQEGVRLWLGKRSATTDAAGYYKFEKIRARKAFVNLDTQTLPVGFVLTVPVTQEAGILNHRSVRLDFGMISRSEIWGVVFLDVNGNGAFNITEGDKGIKGVILTLENGLKVATDGNGQYRFANVSVGEHVVTLDLNSLPVEYLPTVPLKKTAVVFEGVSYNYNIPAKITNE